MNFGNCSQAIIMKMAYSPSDAQDISCTTRVQRGWARTDNLNPVAPEPPVTARADPRPFYPL